MSGQNDPETLDMLGSAYAALGNTPAAVQAFGQAATPGAGRSGHSDAFRPVADAGRQSPQR